MQLLALYTHLLTARAEWLVLVLAIACIIGDAVLRRDMQLLTGRGENILRVLGRKLDRPARGAATLVYRGIIALVLLLVPAVVVGLLISLPYKFLAHICLMLLVLWFGHALSFYSLIRLWNRAKNETVPLEDARTHFLFADTHAVLRHIVLSRSLQFAVQVVGASFWYVLGNMTGLFVYLTVAAAANQYHSVAFGWASRALFRLMDALPRMMAVVLFTLAALFTPQTKPLRALRQRSWQGFVATLLDVSLGGAMPGGNLPWLGSGTAKLTHVHLRRFVHLMAVATLLLILLYAAPTSYKLLINII